MNQEIQEDIQYIESFAWHIDEPGQRAYLFALTAFTKQADAWAGESLNAALCKQVIREAVKLRSHYDLVEETETKTRKVLRAKA